ncbi:unnamed protein product [Pleuronectes platessa]|uniref:Uncharacterized protein n=1 Tax=Pleuronectes platessa TaxID=8262 RepID=A0A9N7W526_PLEPL|nr:unnamed protein product [Pleuronectes platessa]
MREAGMTQQYVITSEKTYFKVESYISTQATPVLTKPHLVIAVLEWPIEEAGQGAASLPSVPCQEGQRMQRSPSHLCPLGCVLTTALDPGDTTETSRGEREEGETPDRVKVIVQPLTESRLMTLDKPGGFMDC